MAAVMAPASPARCFDFDYRSPARCEPVPGNTGCSDLMEEVCSSHQERVAQWRRDKAHALHVEAQRGIQETLREEEGLEQLKADLAAVQELTEAAKHLSSEGSRLNQAIHTSLSAAGHRAQVAAQARDGLRETQQESQKELQQEEHALHQRIQTAEDQMVDIEYFLNRYRDSLGLDICRVAPQTVRLVFGLIDKTRPNREFSVTLALAQQQGYDAFDCSPEVPELAPLMQQLNEDPAAAAALPTFLCGLRRAFVCTANC
eukprot:TRINITY_DN5357_c0_g1_i1.p1 TRINITY_DN5357_c0_g1~~TRINITY_DN5357_c0_g1_i1.p1  ORF type:complete len:281 (+),score=60.89 TRINITY_DN5357_c0_g1_i1:69-845(+)